MQRTASEKEKTVRLLIAAVVLSLCVIAPGAAVLVLTGCRLGTPEFKPQPATLATPPVPPGAVQGDNQSAKAVAPPPAGIPHVFEGSTDLITWFPVSTQSGPQFFMRVVPLTNNSPVKTNDPSTVTIEWSLPGYPVAHYSLRWGTNTEPYQFGLTTVEAQATVSNLAGGDWEFRVSALSEIGMASGYSSNVSYTVP